MPFIFVLIRCFPKLQQCSIHFVNHWLEAYLKMVVQHWLQLSQLLISCVAFFQSLQNKDKAAFQVSGEFFSMFLLIHVRLLDSIFNVQNFHKVLNLFLIYPNKLLIFCLSARLSINFDIHFSKWPSGVSRTIFLHSWLSAKFQSSRC